MCMYVREDTFLSDVDSQPERQKTNYFFPSLIFDLSPAQLQFECTWENKTLAHTREERRHLIKLELTSQLKGTKHTQGEDKI